MRYILFVKYLALMVAMTVTPTIMALPFPEEMSNWSEQEKNAQRKAGRELLVRLNKAIANKDKVFVIPHGNYRFDKVTSDRRPTHVKISGARDLTIEGNGSNFFFETFYNGLLVSKCRNLTIKNLVMDWDPVPFTQGTVVSVDYKKNTFIFKPAPGYEKMYEKLFTSSRIRGILFDPATRKMKYNQGGHCLDIKEKLDGGTYRILVRGFYGHSAKRCGYEPGDLLVILARMHRAVKTNDCKDVVHENIVLHASPFVCFVEQGGLGGNVYQQCKIIKRPGSDRLISGNADGFNSSKNLKGPVLDGCEIENIGDDFVNIHGVYYRIFTQKSPKVLIAQPFTRNGIENPVLSFIENKSWDWLGKRTLVSIKNTTYVIPEQSGVGDRKWAAAKNFKPGSKVEAVEIELDKEIEIKDTVFFSVNASTGNHAVVKNCKFSGSLARGIRLQSQDALIENNIVANCLGPGLTTGGQPGFWGEAVTSQRLIIRNNTFKDCVMIKGDRLPATVMFNAPGTIGKAEAASDILFTGNKIIRSGQYAILLKTSKNVIIKDNTISETGWRSAPGDDPEIVPIILDGVENVKISDNKFIDPGKYASKINVINIK